jgi:hypothetical protein
VEIIISPRHHHRLRKIETGSRSVTYIDARTQIQMAKVEDEQDLENLLQLNLNLS